jgi:hypothetical protein
MSLNLTGFAQITSPSADFIKPTSYVKDTLRTD